MASDHSIIEENKEQNEIPKSSLLQKKFSILLVIVFACYYLGKLLNKDVYC